MNKKFKIIIFLLIFIQGIYAQEAEISEPKNDDTANTKKIESSSSKGIEITNVEFECYINSDFNRTFQFVGSYSFAGKLEFNKRVSVKEGISQSWTENVNDIKIFSNAAYRILADWPLYVNLAWAYNGLPDYDTHSHVIAPLVSWNEKYYGITVGYGFRFTSFFGEGPLIEHLLPMGVYVNFLNNDKICVGMSLANFDDFRMDSFIAFALAAKVSIKVDSDLSIINELEFRQSGVDGLTATFHGIVWKGGIKITW